MEERIELAPNCSLTPTGARRFFVGTCLFSLAFAMIFVVQGFWPVLPFWALEMGALGLALHASMRRRFYTQTLLITDSQVSLVTRSRRGEAKQAAGRQQKSGDHGRFPSADIGRSPCARRLGRVVI